MVFHSSFDATPLLYSMYLTVTSYDMRFKSTQAAKCSDLALMLTPRDHWSSEQEAPIAD
jgi:hypothetical protein